MDARSRIGLVGGAAGFVFGVMLTAGVMSVFNASTPSAATSSRRGDHPSLRQTQVKTYSHRILVTPVKQEEVGDAIASMNLPHTDQQRTRDDLDEGKYRL